MYLFYPEHCIGTLCIHSTVNVVTSRLDFLYTTLYTQHDAVDCLAIGSEGACLCHGCEEQSGTLRERNTEFFSMGLHCKVLVDFVFQAKGLRGFRLGLPNFCNRSVS